MVIREQVPLAPHTSFRLGGPARIFVEVHDEDEVRAAATLALARGLPLLPLGSGSNILVPDRGVEAVVAKIAADDLVFAGDTVTAGAGVPWEALVSGAAARGLWGVENLAGIPGSVGGAVMQNIGAYGAELADTFLSAEVFDLIRGEVGRFSAKEAELTYRSSFFKRSRHLVILRATLHLWQGGTPRLSYPDLAKQQAQGAPLSTPALISAAVKEIRKEKFPRAPSGTAGSFFKNPVLEAEALARLKRRYPELPVYPLPSGGKIALAWLLDHALGLKGLSVGGARLYERQPLVIATSEGAHAEEVDTLALDVARRVYQETGIAIEREVETFGDQEDKERSDYIF